MTLRRPPDRQATRRGITTPLIAAALLLAALGLALVLDRLWLEAAQVELTAAGEAAALAAARALACDERLKPDANGSLLSNRAIDAAVAIARHNSVASAPVELDAEKGDIRFGRLGASSSAFDQPDSLEFGETDLLPTHVQIAAHRSRSRGNPVALFFHELTQQPYGDVVVQVEAGLSNHLVGVRPFVGAPVPALPLAIWREDPTGKCPDTWRHAIEQRRGRDDYGYDADRQEVIVGSDGIPEIVLRTQPRSGATDKVNLHLLDIGTGFDADRLHSQFARGWTVADLEAWDGELKPASAGLKLSATARLQSGERESLESIRGEARICLLYSVCVPAGRSARMLANCVDFVAIRVLVVRDLDDGSTEVIAQPAVIATRTALTETAEAAVANPYIYRLTLTR